MPLSWPVLDEGPEIAAGEVLLRADHVKKYFPIKSGILIQREVARVHAVDDVSFELRAGETLGLVGESGCGKSTLARCIARLYDITSGSVVFEGADISKYSRRQLRPVRRDLQMVFQDPYASLNPRKRVGAIIADPLRIHRAGSRDQIRRRVLELLELVGPVRRAHQPIPARVLRRAAAADRRRPCARAQAEAGHRRRAGVRPRRIDPGAGHQPARRPPG